MNSEKRLPSPFKIDVVKQQDIFDRKGKIQRIVDFLNEHYIIHITAQNPEMITVEPKNPGLYEYPPTFNDIHLHLIELWEENISATLLWEIISSRNYIKPFDPVEDYISSIRTKYKGESHIDLLSKFLIAREFESYAPGECQARVSQLIRKWMVSTIAMWMGVEPNPIMLTFIQSNEGVGKTRLCEFLIPEMLKQYSLTAFQNEDRNEMEDIYTRYYFVVHDELIGINKWTLNRWKQIMTSLKYKTKRRMDKFAIDRNRIGSALGTTNLNKDRGGFIPLGEEGRRYACIELDDIQWEEYMQVVDPNQMWAEALLLYESSKYEYRLTKEDIKDMVTYNSMYMVNSSSFTYVFLLLSKPDNESEGVWMNPTELVLDWSQKEVIRKELIYKLSSVDVGSALTSMGYRCEKRRKCTAPEFANDRKPFPLRRYFVKRNY